MEDERIFSPLATFRALDLTDEQGFFCGRLLADLGMAGSQPAPDLHLDHALWTDGALRRLSLLRPCDDGDQRLAVAYRGP